MKREGPSKYRDELERLLESLEEYPVSVKESIDYRIAHLLVNMLHLADNCESPIEFLLAEKLEANLEVHNNYNRCRFHYYMHTQRPIAIGELTYRVDFLIAPIMHEYDVEYPNLIVECDGHDFHEKTPEQAARDKKKDRDLQLAGYKIIRFTGSEIYNNPNQCANDVISFLKQLEQEFLLRGD